MVEDAFHKFESDAVEILEKLNHHENQTGPDEGPRESLHRRAEKALERMESVKEEAEKQTERDFRDLELAMDRYRVKISEPRYIH